MLMITNRFDYIAPFNPRGDIFQKPSSSSTGSATACAGYPWLDFALGTDTGGSIRHPAGVCGVYGMRPSLYSVSSRGVLPVSLLLDTVGVFARSPAVLEAASKVMIDALQPPKPVPNIQTKLKLLYPIRAKDTNPEDSYRWFPYPGQPGQAAAAEAQFEIVVQKLMTHMGCTRHTFNLDSLWRETHPQGESDSLDEATGSIYTALSTYVCIRQSIDPFISEYKAANNGRLPFIDPIVKARQDYGRKITASQYVDAVESAKMFSTWIRNILFSASSAAEFPLLIFPQSWGRPDYRDERPGISEKVFWSSFSIYSLSYLSGCPDYTVPIGEVLYHSRISDHQEWLPVSLSFLGQPGTDLAMLSLLTNLEKANVVQPPTTGRRMYP